LNLLGLREPDLVGRAAERDRLWAALEAVRRDRNLQVAVIRGVSGIGKSRLATWLTQRAAELGLAETIVVSGADPQVARRLTQRVGGALPPKPAELVETGDPRWGSTPAMRAIVRPRKDAPRIVVVDDAHAAEPAVRLIRGLLAERDDYPAPLLAVLVVQDEAIARTAVEPLVSGLDGLDVVTTVALGPLSPPEQEELVTGLVGLDPEAHSALLAVGSGHPGYLVDRVADWARHRRLAPTPRGFRLVGAPDGATTSSPWAREPEALLEDPEAVAPLEIAALLGHEVDEELWEAVCGGDGPGVDPRGVRARMDLVDRLLAHGLARETPAGFAFAHPDLVDALRASAAAGDRQADHHRRIADALDDAPRNALRRGGHRHGAGQWALAVDALLDGVRWAASHGDRRPLLAELDRAQDAADRAALPAIDPRRARLHLCRSLVLIGLARMAEAEEEALRALDLAERLGDRRLIAEATMRMCDLLPVRGGDWEAARPWFRRFLAVEDASPRPVWGALVRARLAHLDEDRDLVGAARGFDEAERILRGCDPTSAEVATALVEVAALRGDDPEATLQRAARAEELAAEAGDLNAQLYLVFRQHEQLRELGRHRDALAVARRGVRLADQQGDARSSVGQRMHVAFLLADLKEWEAAHAQLVEVRARVHDHPYFDQLSILVDLMALTELGRIDEFDQRLAQLADQVDRLDRDPQIAQGLDELVQALLRRGDRGRAEAVDALASRIRQ
jgi:tetratricopeptide (TPR) repeat protein